MHRQEYEPEMEIRVAIDSKTGGERTRNKAWGEFWRKKNMTCKWFIALPALRDRAGAFLRGLGPTCGQGYLSSSYPYKYYL